VLNNAVSGRLSTRTGLLNKASLKLAAWIDLPESECLQQVRRLEADPVFQKMLSYRVLQRERFHGVSPAVFRLAPERDVPSFVSGFRGSEKEMAAVELIRKLGRPDFEKFFLLPERLYTVAEISRATGLSSQEIGMLADALNNFTPGFYSPAELPGRRDPLPGRPLTVVAGLTWSEGKPVLEDCVFDLCRGRYRLDPARLAELRQELTAEQRKRLSRIVEEINWINRRRSVIYRVLKGVVEVQRKFLVSGDPDDLNGLTQRELSLSLGLIPSTLNRALRNRALRLDSGQVIPLKELLPGRNYRVRRLIRLILKREAGRRVTDRELQVLLLRDYRVRLARRTVNLYRRSAGT